ncbi:MAG: hypothetical protein UX39_C0001G0027 [Candidatus Magasanikbacteria bacterium GW2011_GWA2_46_17]|uniref:Uncharacterized protein n=1 Tax=Candidatus Magasanikbacteria bacterium GW2011_GWA2_46_17 TaxID=1619042 RepID=A0A0G1P3X9_9BACT|nr:MAG: hypothetical protein UX39_C0001G0027 [Candidatus Magasanikbacteria bacterium GW2011_GWA2_46_17]
MSRKLLLLSLLLLVLFPPVVFAEEEAQPEENPLCWREEDCQQARRQFLSEEAADQREQNNGWIRGEKPCDSAGWGKCLPAGVAETQIAFGGQRRFLHVGQFIQIIYNYALRVVAIVAVVVIVVAGIQWTTSGGSSEVIGAAKKRIGGALMGLFLAYMSYSILYTINPSLVNLRLPQVWLLRQVSLIRFVSELPDDVRLVQVADVNGRPVQRAAPVVKNPANMGNFLCGKQFEKEQSDNKIYLGDYCEQAGNVCVQQGNNPPFVCVEGTVYGEIANSGNNNWAFPWTDEGEQELWAVCRNGSTIDVSKESRTFNMSGNKQSFVISSDAGAITRAVRDCGDDDQIKGFVIMFEMDESDDPTDEEHIIGLDGENGVDLGDEEFFERNVARIRDGFFIPLDRIRSGKINMKIDAVRVYDIDKDRDYSNYNNILQ